MYFPSIYPNYSVTLSEHVNSGTSELLVRDKVYYITNLIWIKKSLKFKSKVFSEAATGGVP